MFEISKRDGLARLGKIKTKHGVLDTPTLLPVVNPKILTLSMEELRECGAQGLITNSYIIYKNPELKETAEKKGVHGLLNWDGPIMTDSGTFQSHVYGEIDMQPEEILNFQKKIGVDIGTVLDVFCEPETKFEDAKKELEETQRRIEESDQNKNSIFLAAPIQGGRHLDLRLKAAQMASKTDAELFPIGGVVPLMEKNNFEKLSEVIIASKKGLDMSRPVHLFGCGHPMLFALATFLGCDLFDSSSYAKFASRDSLMFTWGSRNLEELEEFPSEFSAAPGITINELKGMEKKKRQKIIAKHNLIVSFTEIRRVKQAIHDGLLWELVENRLRTSPASTSPRRAASIKASSVIPDIFVNSRYAARPCSQAVRHRFSRSPPLKVRSIQRVVYGISGPSDIASIQGSLFGSKSGVGPSTIVIFSGSDTLFPLTLTRKILRYKFTYKALSKSHNKYRYCYK